MPKNTSKSPDYISPLHTSRLDGRVLRLPAGRAKYTDQEILFVYGLHSSLERWWGLVQALSRYGNVTMPDLPGFGGMDSFYKIHKKPTLDNLADYLAAFVEQHYRRKKLVIIGLSFGFVIATRMLQRHPRLGQQVTLLVSIVGFTHRDDFAFSRSRHYFYLSAARILSRRLPAQLFRATLLQPWVLRNFYGKTHNAKHKFALASNTAQREAIKDMEVHLWHNNDVRTWAFTTAEFLTFDNCCVHVPTPIWHVSATFDNYFDNDSVERNLRTIFDNFDSGVFESKAHAPSVIANEKEAANMLPLRLKHILSKRD